MALTGESGSGKSTLLHLIGGLDRPDSGEIRLFDQEITALGDAARARLRRDKVGLVFQQFNLVPSLTVAQNIALQARLARRADPGWIAELTERLGLTGWSRATPSSFRAGSSSGLPSGARWPTAPT